MQGISLIRPNPENFAIYDFGLGKPTGAMKSDCSIKELHNSRPISVNDSAGDRRVGFELDRLLVRVIGKVISWIR